MGVLRPRLNLSLEYSSKQLSDRRLLICRATAGSTGGAKALISNSGTAMRIYRGACSANDHDVVGWGKAIETSAIFQKHEWIESGEVIRDVVVFTLPEGNEICEVGDLAPLRQQARYRGSRAARVVSRSSAAPLPLPGRLLSASAQDASGASTPCVAV